jgi:hypothetical protein
MKFHLLMMTFKQNIRNDFSYHGKPFFLYFYIGRNSKGLITKNY